jgi:predicted nucleic acid-binding protein
VRYVATFDTNILLSGVGKKLQAKLRFSPAQATDTVADLLTFMRLVTIPNALKIVMADPDDNKVVECAVMGQATHIVTGDRRHLLPLGSYQGIAIVTAADFLTLVSVS